MCTRAEIPAASPAPLVGEPDTDDSAIARVTVTLPASLHARPAGRLAQAAARFASTIGLEYAGQTVNLTGVFAVLRLGATAGTTLTITADGSDAWAAVQSLAQLIATVE
jgi:phosphotransferase system HPr (HPr) family protein